MTSAAGDLISRATNPQQPMRGELRSHFPVGSALAEQVGVRLESDPQADPQPDRIYVTSD